MTIGSHLKEFHEKPVKDYIHGKPFDVKSTAPRLSLDWDAYEKGKKWADLLEEFLMAQDATRTTHLVIGAAEGFEGDMTSSMTLPALIANKDKLSHLQALFIGDITYEECELSWINAGDFSELWKNFPNLKALGIRGYPGILGEIDMPDLEYLTIQCSGMTKQNAVEIQAANLPKIKRLELWIGTDHYGGTTTVQDWRPILSGSLFPSVTHLGLMNCSFVDDIAKALEKSEIVGRLKTLDLSMGNMSDDGGVAIYTTENIRKLESLNLRHHFMTDWMVGRFQGKDLPAPRWPEPEAPTPAVGSPQKKIGFFDAIFGKKTTAAQPAPTIDVNDSTRPKVDYGSVPILSDWPNDLELNLAEQQDMSEFEYRYVAVAE